MLRRIVTATGLSLFALSLAGCVVEERHHPHDGYYHDHDRRWDRDRDGDRDHWRHDGDWR